MNTLPPVTKLRVSRAGLLCTALLAATAFTAQAQNTGFGTITPASKVTVKGNLAVGSSTFIPTAAPTNGAIIQGFTGIGVVVPSHQLHVFAAADPVRFEGLQPSTDAADANLVVTSTGVVKTGAPIRSKELIQTRSNTYQVLFESNMNVPIPVGDLLLASTPGASAWITYTPTSVTLQPGRLYKLSFDPVRLDASHSGYILHQFYNDTAGAYFGPRAQWYGTDNGGSTATLTSGLVTAYIMPTVPTTVSMRVRIATQTPVFGSGSGLGEGLMPNLTVETMD